MYLVWVEFKLLSINATLKCFDNSYAMPLQCPDSHTWLIYKS